MVGDGSGASGGAQPAAQAGISGISGTVPNSAPASGAQPSSALQQPSAANAALASVASTVLTPLATGSSAQACQAPQAGGGTHPSASASAAVQKQLAGSAAGAAAGNATLEAAPQKPRPAEATAVRAIDGANAMDDDASAAAAAAGSDDGVPPIRILPLDPPFALAGGSSLAANGPLAAPLQRPPSILPTAEPLTGAAAARAARVQQRRLWNLKRKFAEVSGQYEGALAEGRALVRWKTAPRPPAALPAELSEADKQVWGGWQTACTYLLCPQLPCVPPLICASPSNAYWHSKERYRNCLSDATSRASSKRCLAYATFEAFHRGRCPSHSQALAESHRRRLADAANHTCGKALRELMRHQWAYIFNTPVDTNVWTDYLDVVKNPLDFGTVRARCEARQYATPQQFHADVVLVLDNARTYNPAGTDVFRIANIVQVCRTVHLYRAQAFHVVMNSWSRFPAPNPAGNS